MKETQPLFRADNEHMERQPNTCNLQPAVGRYVGEQVLDKSGCLKSDGSKRKNANVSKNDKGVKRVHKAAARLLFWKNHFGFHPVHSFQNSESGPID